MPPERSWPPGGRRTLQLRDAEYAPAVDAEQRDADIRACEANNIRRAQVDAPQLISLALCLYEDLDDQIDDFLRLCTRLENSLTEPVDGLRDRFAAIPVPIQRWTVQWAMDGALVGVREALEADIPALAKLKVLVLELGGSEFEDEDEGIENTCKARGIQLELVE